jgi:hypothetical protein
MQRTDKNFRQQAMTEEETNAFLDEMFNELFDTNDIDSETDQIPNLQILGK